MLIAPSFSLPCRLSLPELLVSLVWVRSMPSLSSAVPSPCEKVFLIVRSVGPEVCSFERFMVFYLDLVTCFVFGRITGVNASSSIISIGSFRGSESLLCLFSPGMRTVYRSSFRGTMLNMGVITGTLIGYGRVSSSFL